MLSTLSRFQRALTPETVARHQPRGGGRQSLCQIRKILIENFKRHLTELKRM